MKKIFVCFLLGVGVASVVLASSGAMPDTIRPNVVVAGIEVGGLTPEEAERQLRIWWEGEKLKPLKLHSDRVRADWPQLHASEMGIALDDVATVSKLPLQDPANAATRQEYSDETFEPVYKQIVPAPDRLEKVIEHVVGRPRPARVVFWKGQVVREPEVTTETLDRANLAQAVAQAIKSGGVVELPLFEGQKKIADDVLAPITDVVSEFSTHFPKRQYNRNSNIRLASARLNGVILMPGEQLSFNHTVGERTIQHGFKLAGVYKNGKHDTGIGGGICQVSTTLYNASLFGNLKIVRRSNHSMPVAYVPLGRDATVDYGSLDLVVQNPYPTPIAIASEFKPGTLTFRVLGKKVPGQTIKVIQVGSRSWDRGVDVIQDSHLAPGERRLVDKGSRGHSIRSFRLVYKNGVLVEKQPLGFSYYGGGDRIIAVGPTPHPVGIPSIPPVQATRVRPVVQQRAPSGG